MSIKPKDVLAFAKNFSLINHLYFSGGESSLYIDLMEEILDLLKENGVQINFVRVNSNIFIRNQKFVDFMNKIGTYSNYPEEVKLLVSKDRFHTENMEKMGLAKNHYEKNLNWYRSKLNDNIIIRENGSANTWLTLQGRAKNLSIEELKKENYFLTKDDVEAMKNNPIFPKMIKDRVDMEDCFEQLFLSSEGYIYKYDISYELQRMNEHELSIGHVEDGSLESLLKRWNDRTGMNEVKKVVKILECGFDFKERLVSITNDVISAVYDEDEDKLLKCKDRIDEIMKEYEEKVSRQIELDRKRSYKTKRPEMGDAIVEIVAIQKLVETLLSFDSWFLRKFSLLWNGVEQKK